MVGSWAYTYPDPTQWTTMVNYDASGGNDVAGSSAPGKSPQDCINQCVGMPGCVATVYQFGANGGTCYPKKGLASMGPSGNGVNLYIPTSATLTNGVYNTAGVIPVVGTPYTRCMPPYTNATQSIIMSGGVPYQYGANVSPLMTLANPGVRASNMCYGCW